MTETRWPIWTHHPLGVRSGTSDSDVYGQVFIDREYAFLDDLPTPELVVDCGAYVGYSPAYFLSRWPGCSLVAIEPDPDSFRLCVDNLARYSDAVILNAALWSHSRGVTASNSPYRDGREWANHVRECEPGEAPTIATVAIGWILGASNRGRISLLKMDIEGAESVVFSAPDLSWLDRVDAIAIEIHDDSSFGPCSPLIARVMADRGFAAGTRHGELTSYRRPA